jgi:hypothetical protein
MRTKSESQAFALGALGLALLVLAAYGDVLLAPGDRVLSSERGDVAYYFARLRGFAFGEIARGNLPLWNPHLFSGTPLLGGFQAGLLYPPNLIYAVLPLARAIDLDIALHVFLTGLFAFAWVRGRGVHPLGAFVAGTLAMFAGACALRVMAGQLSLLAANAWTPLVWLAVDRLLDRPTPGWCLAGIAAVTLQVLAGYPFSVFATALVAGATVVLRLPRCPDRPRSLLALAAVGIAPIALSAVQLWTGLETGAESTRAAGVSLLFAQSHSVPLENLITLLVPAFYGDLLHVNYWGRWWIWDVSIFLGAPALALAAIGVHYGRAEQLRLAPIFALLLLLLALGSETPLHGLLYHTVPGFDRFRAPSKFAFHMTLFVALLAGIGIDHLWRDERGARPAAAVAAGLATALAALGLWIRREALGAPDGGAWGEHVLALGSAWRYTEDFARETALWAARGLWQAAAVCAALAGLLAWRPRRRLAVAGLVLLAAAELLGFARTYRAGFSLAELSRSDLAEFVRQRAGEDRFMIQPEGTWAHANQPLEDGVLSVWGYDPIQLERYVRVLFSLHEDDSERARTPDSLQFDGPLAYHPVYRLVRCRYSFLHGGTAEHPGGLPRFSLLRDYRVLEREAALRTVLDPAFDPHATVLLEQEPAPAPAPATGAGRIALLDESTDHVTLEVELEAPAILLMSDAYSTGWRAVPVVPGPQRRYEVLPADSILRAVPLAAGTHRLRIEYAPLGWRVGRWISGISLLAFAAAVAVYARQRLRAGHD